jgi:NAD(P)-dependent dehydrogenase (short-subunit alcohol dehydrogenase family)
VNPSSAASAVVTGAASGLGRATAEALAETGMKVAVLDIDDERGRKVAADIGGVFCHVDITNEDSVVSAFAAAREAHGQERVCVHCAFTARNGVVLTPGEGGSWDRFSSSDFAYSVEGVLTSSYRVAAIAAAGMATLDPLEDGERGTIVMTASAAAEEPRPGQVAYAAAKAGVRGLAMPMALELMDLGIRVNAVLPGIFSTPAVAALKEHLPAEYDAMVGAVGFPRRAGRAEEFAAFVLELVRNTYLNGQAFRIDGAIRLPSRR